MNFSGDGNDESELVVRGLEFEQSLLGGHVDTGENGGLRFCGESLAHDLQGRDEIASRECDVHGRSFPGSICFSVLPVFYDCVI